MSAGRFCMRTEGHVVLREKGLVRTQTFGIQIKIHSSGDFISSVPPCHDSETGCGANSPAEDEHVQISYHICAIDLALQLIIHWQEIRNVCLN